jgi:hypothetical protein
VDGFEFMCRWGSRVLRALKNLVETWSSTLQSNKIFSS